MPSFLETTVQVLLEEFPEGIAIRPNDHCSTNRPIAGQLSFPDDIYIPPVFTCRANEPDARYEVLLLQLQDGTFVQVQVSISAFAHAWMLCTDTEMMCWCL